MKRLSLTRLPPTLLVIGVPLLACSGLSRGVALETVPTELVEVQLQGTQLVIDQPCEAANGALSIRGGDTLLENLGQEVVTYQITGATRSDRTVTLEVALDGEPQPAFILRRSKKQQHELYFVEREGSPARDVPEMFVDARESANFQTIKEDCPPIE